VRAHAEGKVWSGVDFAKVGFVDGTTDFLGLMDTLKQVLGRRIDERMAVHFYPEVRVDLRSLITERLPFAAQIQKSVLDSFEAGLLGLVASGKCITYCPEGLQIRF